MSKDLFKDIADMHKHYGHEQRMDPHFLGFRLAFCLEELTETITSADEGRPEDIVDGLIDLMVVTIGLLDLAKVDGQRAWDRVFEANMKKVSGANATRPGSDGQDLVKPEGWVAPRHDDNVGLLEMSSGQLAPSFPYCALFMMKAIKKHILDKAVDYNSSGVMKGEYFIHGVNDLEYELNKKMLRFRSVLGNIREGQEPKFESLIDTCGDAMAYYSFMVEWLEGKMQGQDTQMDLFNNPKKNWGEEEHF
jgi:NTP pyrophosphatase (non-canonical NTP hydrolase)